MQELQWRSFAVLFWELACLPVVLSVYLMAVKFSIIRPIQWISGRILYPQKAILLKIAD